MKLTALAFAALISGCTYTVVKNGGSGGDTHVSADQLAAPDYKVVSSTVIEQNCLGCHSLAHGNQGGVNLETYENVRALGNRVEFRAVEKGDMPPGNPLSQVQKTILGNWIDEGMPESFAGGVVEKPDPTLEAGPDDWSKVRDKVFGKKCAGCHSGDTAAKGLDLTDYKKSSAAIEDILKRAVHDLDMPVPPLPSLSKKEREVLVNWYINGTPQ